MMLAHSERVVGYSEVGTTLSRILRANCVPDSEDTQIRRKRPI
jgi:hypothetical protein